MAKDADVLELLRSRLADMETRQRSSGSTSASDFWERMTGGMPSSATAPEVSTAPQAVRASTVAGAHAEVPGFSAESGPTSGGCEASGREARRRTRRVAPESRPLTRGHGPWSTLSIEQLESLESLDLQTLEPMSDDDYAEMVDDPTWLETTAARAEARADDGGRTEREQMIAIDAVLGRSLCDHAETDLAAAAERFAHERRNHEVILVTIVAELVSRGVDAPDGLSRTDWLRSHDASLTAGQAKALVTVGTALADARWARLRLLVTTQQVTVGNAALIVDFHGRTEPVADSQDLETALDDLTDQARQLRPEELARLVRHHTEQIKPPRDEDALDRGRREARGLWFTQPNPAGMVGMRGVLDPEGAAAIKAAIDPLSIPRPETDAHGRTVAPDSRTPARRRMEALLDIVRRGVASADGVPTTDKAKVVVFVDLETLVGDLRDAHTRGGSSRAGAGTRSDGGRHSGLGARAPSGTGSGTATGPGTVNGTSSGTANSTGTGTGTGITLTGDVLSPGVVRRMACDAEIIPVVLGGDSEPLDVGRGRRFYTPAQRRALTVRDKGCSWQGCTVPATWCDAHHVVEWRHGGDTSLLTGALLCPRHHTEVHDRNLTATVTSTGVTWHT